ncbi:MAG: acyl-CoA thioesterase [Trueperaceae bacterium]|nr:MAG: acyl-CoA thioesterase [Trueperaceae bacterium]
MATVKLRVRYAETDQMGIAHHSAYVVWLEAARIEWLRNNGLNYRLLEADGILLPVHRLTIEYRSSARFDDLLETEARLTSAQSRRLRFDYRLLRRTGIENRDEDRSQSRHRGAGETTLLASATTFHTPTDHHGRAVRMPGTWLEKLRKHLDEGES